MVICVAERCLAFDSTLAVVRPAGHMQAAEGTGDTGPSVGTDMRPVAGRLAAALAAADKLPAGTPAAAVAAACTPGTEGSGTHSALGMACPGMLPALAEGRPASPAGLARPLREACLRAAVPFAAAASAGTAFAEASGPTWRLFVLPQRMVDWEGAQRSTGTAVAVRALG
jgi:hypothetical protein